MSEAAQLWASLRHLQREFVRIRRQQTIKRAVAYAKRKNLPVNFNLRLQEAVDLARKIEDASPGWTQENLQNVLDAFDELDAALDRAG